MTALLVASVLVGALLGAAVTLASARRQRDRINRRADMEAAARVAFQHPPTSRLRRPRRGW